MNTIPTPEEALRIVKEQHQRELMNMQDCIERQAARYNDLMGQIRAMKTRSDEYYHEAAPGSDEAEKHLRVFNVLKELERLGESFRNR